MTAIGSGSSVLKGSTEAATEAVRTAAGPLGGKRPTFGVLFGSPDHNLEELTVAAREAAQGAPIAACTTAGEITQDGLTHGGVSCLLVASDECAVTEAFATGLKINVDGVTRLLVSADQAARESHGGKGFRHTTSVLLTDGLAGTGETLVTQLFDALPSGSQIVGGAAGDEGRFVRTEVAGCGQASADAASVLHVMSAKPWGVGVGHGLRPTTKPMRVTRAEGNVIHEIEGQPAFEIYRHHAAERGVELSPESAGPYMIGNELGIHFFESIARARAPLSVGSDGSLSCAADVPRGSMVSILDGEPRSMIHAARTAAEEAREHLDGPAAGVLLFDCVCRGMILKNDFEDEIRAVRSVFGDVPLAGFLTYGEIARYTGKLDGWHNTTAVVVAIPA